MNTFGLPVRILSWSLALLAIQGFAQQHAELPDQPAFATVVPAEQGSDNVAVEGFALDVTPVSNAEYQQFVSQHPRWRRSEIAELFADQGYLQHWHSDQELGNALPEQPVTQISWFAARAYCEAQGGRLPSWYEWEYAAAADAQRADARDDPQWRQRILAWYAVPSNRPLSGIARGEPNYWGLHDMNSLVWEWVEDYNGLLVSSDNREQGGADQSLYCGAGALSLEQKENYAVLMRLAMLSSLAAKSTTKNLGFRCAYDMPMPDES